MKKHSWTLPLLSEVSQQTTLELELTATLSFPPPAALPLSVLFPSDISSSSPLDQFFPSNPSLLGMNKNAGQQILIRLRPAHSEDTFLELDDLMGTMLHELTHNIFGPHDDKFYAFLKVLTAEFDALIAGGYSGLLARPSFCFLSASVLSLSSQRPCFVMVPQAKASFPTELALEWEWHTTSLLNSRRPRLLQRRKRERRSSVSWDREGRSEASRRSGRRQGSWLQT